MVFDRQPQSRRISVTYIFVIDRRLGVRLICFFSKVYFFSHFVDLDHAYKAFVAPKIGATVAHIFNDSRRDPGLKRSSGVRHTCHDRYNHAPDAAVRRPAARPRQGHVF